MDYLDFELEVTRVGGRDCEIASRSPAGEARAAARFPFDDLALKSRLQALQLALRRSGGTFRRVRSTEEQVVEDFGLALFNFLTAGQVRAAYDVSKREAVAAGKGLRLVLRIRDPELAALPWEFLYDPHKAEYICLSRHTPIVRYPDLPQPVPPLAVRPPLRILGMAVSPSDLDPLDMEREKLRVEEAVGRLQGQVSLEWLGGGGWRDVLDAMRGGPWHVFHFIGHGGFNRGRDEGVVAVAGDDGRAFELSATKLARLLDHPHLKLVLLNACEGAHASGLDIFSSTASILVRSGIPAVLAMQYEITDAAAIEFSHSFYGALAGGMPVEAAVSDARKAVSVAVNNTVEWGTPVLYLRARDGRLFDIGLRREQVEALYGDAKKALDEGDWDAAIEKLTVVLNTDRASDKARAALQHAVEQRAFSDLYAEGLRHYEEGRRAEALELFVQIEARAAGYRDVGALAESARRELREEEERLRTQEAEARARESEAQRATGEDAGGAQAQAAAAVEPAAAPPVPTPGLRPAVGVRVSATTFNKWRVVTVVLVFVTVAVCLALISSNLKTSRPGRAGNSAPTHTPTPPKVVQGGLPLTIEPLGEITAGHDLWEVAFSPDGQTLAAVGRDNGVGLWSVAERNLYTYLRTESPSRSVAFSLDGMTVASGDDKGKIRLWGLKPADSYPAYATWQGHNKWVFTVAFSADSADGRTLAAGGGTHLALWRGTGY